jgi:hypothetical protein
MPVFESLPLLMYTVSRADVRLLRPVTVKSQNSLFFGWRFQQADFRAPRLMAGLFPLASP